MNMRRFVLWLTGRDQLAKSRAPTRNFRLTVVSPEWGITIEGPVGPNVMHRLAQRIVLGFKWELLP